MDLGSNCFGQELSPASLVKLVSFLFWSGLYLHSVVAWPQRSPEWCSRIVTLLHGSVATVVGLSQCAITNLTPFRLTRKWDYEKQFSLVVPIMGPRKNALFHAAAKITAFNYALMVWSWGYFAFDLLWCLVYWSESILMLCHHTSALIAITIYMHKDYTGCTFACTLAMMEITNPLLQTRWFLRDEGYDTTTVFLIVEVLYLGMFLFVRAILGTWLIYKILDSQLFDMDEKIISIIFYFVSMAFVYEIVGYVTYRYKAKLGAVREFLDDIGIIGSHQ